MGVGDYLKKSTSHPARRKEHGMPSLLQLQTLLLLLSLLAEIPSTFAQEDANNGYCSIRCRGAMHTMCIYPPGPGRNCSQYRPDHLSGPERAALLHKHNELRNSMALGQVQSYPSASNMMEMIWDDELTTIAQRWADQCTFRHDRCRNTRRFNVGQNLAVFFTNGPNFPAPETRVQSWYDEIQLYHYSPGPFKFSVETGHFTQIVWGSTTRLGCARSRYVSNNFPHQLLVCNYGPAGNIMGRPLYSTGRPCSRCRCSNNYKGLCAPGSRIVEDENDFSISEFIPSYSPFLFDTTTNTPSFFNDNLFSFFNTNPSTYNANPSTYNTYPSTYNTYPSTYNTTTQTYTTAPPTYNTKKQTFAVQTRTYTQATAATPSYVTTKPTKAPYATYQTTKRSVPTVAPTKKHHQPPTTKKPTFQTVYQTTKKATPAHTTAVTRRPTVTTPPTTTLPATFPPPSCPLPAGPGVACGPKRPAPLPLSSSERAALLRLHNKWRAEVAAGGVKGFPPAANMREMVWDDELTEAAQRWANQCIWGYDPCQKSARFIYKGQNIALSYTINDAVEQRALEWFDEARHHKFADAPYQFALNTSRFTQMAWADTYSLGCARARFPYAGDEANLLICNYGPGGNIPGKKIYIPGPPCSRCSKGATCSGTYPSLCAAPGTTTTLPSTTPTTTTPFYVPTTTDNSQQFQRANELDAGLPPSPYLRPSACPRPKGPGPSCGDNYRAVPLSAEERQALLDAHNRIRNTVAAGNVRKLPIASNMNQLEWDDNLAELAQAWADQCTLGYDACARTDSYHAGQNMAVWYNHDFESFPAPQDRVDGWFKEIENYNYTNGIFTFSVKTSALSQLLWASTRKLGCGRSRFVPKGTQIAAELLVCDYGPGGNVIGRRLYQSGQPCSRCDPGTKCSATYPALCTA